MEYIASLLNGILQHYDSVHAKLRNNLHVKFNQYILYKCIQICGQFDHKVLRDAMKQPGCCPRGAMTAQRYRQHEYDFRVQFHSSDDNNWSETDVTTGYLN